VTWHGFALNVTTDPAAFGDIVPCGLHHVAMSSVARELGAAPGAALFERAREAVASAFAERLG
jgi:lipoyl(octanoyl) transferase